MFSAPGPSVPLLISELVFLPVARFVSSNFFSDIRIVPTLMRPSSLSQALLKSRRRRERSKRDLLRSLPPLRIGSAGSLPGRGMGRADLHDEAVESST